MRSNTASQPWWRVEVVQHGAKAFVVVRARDAKEARANAADVTGVEKVLTAEEKV